MKKATAIIIFLALQTMAVACPVCERANAKKAFGNIGHGIAPQSIWDYAAVWLMIIIVVLTLFFSVKWLIKPGEKNEAHIKYSILNFDQ